MSPTTIFTGYGMAQLIFFITHFKISIKLLTEGAQIIIVWSVKCHKMHNVTVRWRSRARTPRRGLALR